MSDIEKEKQSREFYFALLEMRDIEEFLVKRTNRLRNQTDNPQGDAFFAKWSRESTEHQETLQDILDNIPGKTCTPGCKICLEGIVANSYSKKRLTWTMELEKDASSITGLYDVAKEHVNLESNAQRRYAEMAEMTDDPETKKKLMGLSEAERIHHDEAKQLMGVLEKMMAKAENN